MTTTAPRPSVSEIPAGISNIRVAKKGNVFVDWLTTTDHKKIGYLYLITSFVYFLIGGVMALVIRAQLFAPGLEIVATKEQYNQLFTMHGTIMLLMFATPLFAGFVNVLMPLQIGAPDVAFPRLNASRASLPPKEQRLSVGLLTRHSPVKHSRRVWAGTCGFLGLA